MGIRGKTKFVLVIQHKIVDKLENPRHLDGPSVECLRRSKGGDVGVPATGSTMNQEYNTNYGARDFDRDRERQKGKHVWEEAGVGRAVDDDDAEEENGLCDPRHPDG
ncbi:hypothetical protein H0H81_002715 [Sphagnurus paluster]|uniref:Uncharacterized protein n=1 Tax=Sphagnurus paluster TaxID=117069 RepID=A0A9P7KGK6_9AGAR|nr:hypothetical protein H0H81_002715 [Sphagnurus paluster]